MFLSLWVFRNFVIIRLVLTIIRNYYLQNDYIEHRALHASQPTILYFRIQNRTTLLKTANESKVEEYKSKKMKREKKNLKRNCIRARKSLQVKQLQNFNCWELRMIWLFETWFQFHVFAVALNIWRVFHLTTNRYEQMENENKARINAKTRAIPNKGKRRMMKIARKTIVAQTKSHTKFRFHVMF